jgi:hypothetical protein
MIMHGFMLPVQDVLLHSVLWSANGLKYRYDGLFLLFVQISTDLPFKSVLICLCDGKTAHLMCMKAAAWQSKFRDFDVMG